ncbi:MAG: response regulator [Candidatus Melainabacteria bacterium]|nr:response regulator [Candidatus Melainabacteria bacterium]
MTRTALDTDRRKTKTVQDALQLSVLLVEDSFLQQHVVVHLLKQLGHAVSIASDGFEALSAVQQHSGFDVILMDCHMPLMDGFEAARLIKNSTSLNGSQIAIVGLSADALAEDCFSAGMDDFVRKPVNRQILGAVLSRWSRQKRATHKEGYRHATCYTR